MTDDIHNVIPGNLIYVVKYKEHNNFEVKNKDLFTEINISLYEALIGGTRYIKFLDQREKKKCLLKEQPYPKHYK